MPNFTFHGIELPHDLQESLDAFASNGRPTGGFLEACIDNNLLEACKRADADNLHRIPAIVAYLYNQCDLRCWGHSGAFEAWIIRKRKEREARECAEMEQR